MNTVFVNCDAETISTGILAECKDAQKIELVGRYEHPEHAGSADWMIGLYTITTAEGCTIRAASTNGDPVWEEQDAQAFGDLLEEYGIDA